MRPSTKSEILANIAASSNLSRKQVLAVFNALAEIVQKNLGKKGPGVITIPGLVKIQVVEKPARAARKGINPFTNQEQMFKARPARRVVRIRPLVALKDMANQAMSHHGDHDTDAD